MRGEYRDPESEKDWPNRWRRFNILPICPQSPHQRPADPLAANSATTARVDLRVVDLRPQRPLPALPSRGTRSLGVRQGQRPGERPRHTASSDPVEPQRRHRPPTAGPGVSNRTDLETGAVALRRSRRRGQRDQTTEGSQPTESTSHKSESGRPAKRRTGQHHARQPEAPTAEPAPARHPHMAKRPIQEHVSERGKRRQAYESDERDSQARRERSREQERNETRGFTVETFVNTNSEPAPPGGIQTQWSCTGGPRGK